MSESITVAELRPHYQTDDKNTAYYDGVFSNMLAGNMWQANFVSAFFPLPWMLYRRMYAAAFIYNVTVSLILNLIPKDYILVFIPLNILMMLFGGNLIYFRALLKKINHPPKIAIDQQACLVYVAASILMSLLAQSQNAFAYVVELVFWVWLYLYRVKSELYSP